MELKPRLTIKLKKSKIVALWKQANTCKSTDCNLHELYDEFRYKHENKELELCLYDTNPVEDMDWLELFEGYQ